MANKILILFLVFLTVVEQAWATKCYACTACNDPFKKDGKATMDCQYGCIKTKAKGVVARACSPTKMTPECTEGEEAGVKAIMCYCEKDLCNGSDLDCDKLDCTDHGKSGSNGHGASYVSTTVLAVVAILKLLY